MSEQPVILFDGVCNLCNGFVQFVIRHDRERQFRFASLQSEAGSRILREHDLPHDQLSTMVLSLGDRHFIKSDAALEVVTRLGGAWKLLTPLKWIPAFLRNWGYNFIAVNRYRFFGRNEVCLLPTPELRERFL